MRFAPPSDWPRFETVDAHTGGEPLRIVTSGIPAIPGDTMLEKRRWAREHLDHVRRVLMLEPRGHADMYGALPTSPVTPDGDLGVLFVHNDGFSTMCGHGIIALTKVALECGLVEPAAPGVLRIDTPAGRVTARADLEDARVAAVQFENVPSFVLAQDLITPVPSFGKVTCDVAFGGAFYAYVDARELGLEVAPSSTPALVDAATRIKEAVAAQVELAHPSERDPDINFLYGVVLSEPTPAPATLRNVCVFADGEVDRSPTGTGVSGHAARLHARGELATGASITIESILGSAFDVRVKATCGVGPLSAVIPVVRGTAHVTGRHEFVVDPGDPLGEGFLLR